MALDSDRLGTAIAAAITANAPSDNTPVTPTQLTNIWKAVALEIVNEFKNNGEVLPGSFLDSTAAPITGTGEIS